MLNSCSYSIPLELTVPSSNSFLIKFSPYRPLCISLFTLSAMRILSWLHSCSSATATATLNKKPPLPASDDTPSSTSPDTSTSTSTTATISSLQSNLSVQTHPSVPSLQKLPSHGFINSVVVSQHCLASLNPHPSHPLTCLAVHGDLLYAASSHQITVYDRRTCTDLRSFGSQHSSSGSTKALAFCNEMILTTHQDSKIRVWKLLPDKKYQMVTALPTVNDRLRRFLLPKNYVTVRRHRKLLWIQHADAVTSLAVYNDIIYSVSWDKSMKIWRACDLRCVESVKAHDDAVSAVVVSKDGTVYTGSADKRIRVWSKPDGENRHVLVATLEKHKSVINALALNQEGTVLFSGACDRSILVWEREHSANHMVVSGALRGHEKAILCLINVRDLLLSGSADRTVRIWKQGVPAGSYCCIAVLVGHQMPVKSLAAVTEPEGGTSEPNGGVSVFSGSLDGEIRVWRVSIRDDVDDANLNDASGVHR